MEVLPHQGWYIVLLSELGAQLPEVAAWPARGLLC